ncbi:MAG TPA: aminoglycoside phosphotransferase family protein, partial [Anaerolineales bacterium]|nr:aminoglycoside phosphotransferase family protein [Anaerolineales bacterium]
MNLPPEFIQNIEGTFGEAGKQFLANLPASIEEASQRWGLTDIQPVPTLSYNFAAFANCGSEHVVLKMGVPNRELKSEMAALRLFNGEGACRLIDYDEEKYWLLLERLKPGVMLLTLKDDEEATHIAAEVAQKIWKPLDNVTLSKAKGLDHESPRLSPAPPGTEPPGRRAPGAGVGRGGRSLRVTYNSFIRLSDWFNGLQRLRAKFNGGTGPFNEKLVERVEHSVKDFFLENHKPVLMHGDFHHYNILSSGRGWLVIDPKGVIGPACYEVGPFLLNPWGELLKLDHHRRMTQRRIDILHEHLGFERHRIREWGLAHAILSSWWSMESHSEWRYASAFAEV